MTPFFTASEFLSDREVDVCIREIFPEWKELVSALVEEWAKHSNKLLAERGIEVYSNANVPNVFKKDAWFRVRNRTATHKALLIQIEEIGE